MSFEDDWTFVEGLSEQQQHHHQQHQQQHKHQQQQQRTTSTQPPVHTFDDDEENQGGGFKLGKFSFQKGSIHISKSSAQASESSSKAKKKLTNLYYSGKFKIMASLYNLYRRYPSDLPEFSMSPIWLLGNCFSPSGDVNLQDPEEEVLPQHVTNFLENFHALLWFSYRKDFPAIEKTSITTDIGWGCMLRTGQMLFAQALVRHFIGKEWKPTIQDKFSPFSSYRQILRWFCDSPQQPYSIHNIVKKNRQMNIRNGTHSPDDRIQEWYAPTRIAVVLKSLVKKHCGNSLVAHVIKDSIVYIDQLIGICDKKEKKESIEGAQIKDISEPGSFEGLDILRDPPEDSWRSLILIIPLRLGVETVTPLYVDLIKSAFRIPQCIGIMGGKPKQGYYFVGYQDDQVIYLDPHIVHPCLHDSEFSPETYHCQIPQKINFTSMDPSVALGFYCHDRQEFFDLMAHLHTLSNDTHVITITPRSPDYVSDPAENSSNSEDEEASPSWISTTSITTDTSIIPSSNEPPPNCQPPKSNVNVYEDVLIMW